jgi:hypothetical protein
MLKIVGKGRKRRVVLSDQIAPYVHVCIFSPCSPATLFAPSLTTVLSPSPAGMQNPSVAQVSRSGLASGYCTNSRFTKPPCRAHEAPASSCTVMPTRRAHMWSWICLVARNERASAAGSATTRTDPGPATSAAMRDESFYESRALGKTLLVVRSEKYYTSL